MVDVWPATLPQVMRRDAYSESSADSLLESQPDQGPPITRRRSSSAPRMVECTTPPMTEAQMATLKTFVKTALVGGSLYFTFPAQSEEGTWLVKFRKGQLPVYSDLGGWWQASFGLWVMP